jgi:hypothetical protein
MLSNSWHSSHPSSPAWIFYLIDPPSDMERAIFELDAIALAATKKFDGILVDERHVPQIQNQLLPRCLDGEHLFELLDILCCFDPAAECEQNLTVRCSPSSQHASSPCLKAADEAGSISLLCALLNETQIGEKQFGGQRQVTDNKGPVVYQNVRYSDNVRNLGRTYAGSYSEGAGRMKDLTHRRDRIFSFLWETAS